MIRNKPQRHGLRYTVRLYGTVVEQGVHWGPRKASSTAWDTLDLAVPTDSGNAFARFRWMGGHTVEVDGEGDGALCQQINAQKGWAWENGKGVRVELDLIPRKPAQRLSGEMWGDVALMVMMLTLTVGVGQLNFVLRQLMDGVVVAERAMEPSPELIARLLLKDYAGAETGSVERGHERRPFGANPSFSLPMGGDGPLDRTGGAERVGDHLDRGNAERMQPSKKVATQDQPHERLLDDVVGDLDWVAEVAEVERDQEETLPATVEKFLGWGFEDWLDVPEAGDLANQKMVRHLNLSRVRMLIDPDDKFAILTVAYYAYLSQNLSLCRDLYARYVHLYPDDSAGYNNLALTYKRSGEYPEEERLYRIALKLNPDDTNVMNNLAVNLAHQGRFEAATAVMEDLERQLPGDAYAELHRAKLFASMGQKQRSLRHLRRALDGAWTLDSFHHIEFRQDLKLDPSFADLRKTGRFKRAVTETYGKNARSRLGEWSVVGEVRDG